MLQRNCLKIGFVFLMLFSLVAHAGNSFDFNSNPLGAVAGGGDPGPWPFGLEKPFPWREIQGVWSADVDGLQRVFVFKVLGGSQGKVRKLVIAEYDAGNCEIVSEGKGFEEVGVRVLTAGMVGSEGRFMVEVRAFKESDVKKVRKIPGSSSSEKTLMAISMAPWNDLKKKNTYPLTKLSPVPFFECEVPY